MPRGKEEQLGSSLATSRCRQADLAPSLRFRSSIPGPACPTRHTCLAAGRSVCLSPLAASEAMEWCGESTARYYLGYDWSGYGHSVRAFRRVTECCYFVLAARITPGSSALVSVLDARLSHGIAGPASLMSLSSEHQTFQQPILHVFGPRSGRLQK
ncbi:uncharacterized protein THITE_2121764 [Thermothielavioides terrestris NRRL 8126]|uniref:Uncharacterized protein n=1 Tax=Thermothielavioides terrestris (strain ATCC 38088 / NRRL 8126) TaxID=578455 RepID=G2RF98_THETT|nr:uncharacterized protein THITE_2121764 [Thermothielavioides terrestris NRRL 8126]AEO70381.1 hypothetical protein THITE_2121764 [Thermothielavioides terrestris NRRL 8126]